MNKKGITESDRRQKLLAKHKRRKYLFGKEMLLWGEIERHRRLEVQVAPLLAQVSQVEAQAVCGMAILVNGLLPQGREPDELDTLAEAVLLSKPLALKCLRVFFELGKLEGKKLVTA